MKRRFCGVLFLVLLLSMTFVVAGTTKITVRMGDDYNALIRVKDGEVILDTPKVINYPMGLAELEYNTSRSQADYLILVHSSGNVVDSYTLNDIDTGSELKVDFRDGVPPVVTDLELEQPAEEPETEIPEEVPEETNVTEDPADDPEAVGFDFSEGLSTGKAVFYSNEDGFSIFSWILLGVIVLIVVVFIFSKMKDRGKEEVDKYKHELDSIRKRIRKKIREIKVLKARGMKLKKMIELEEGFLEEKKDLKNVEKEVDKATEEEKKKKD